MRRDPLPQLRAVRDQIRKVDVQRADLVDSRNRLIHQALRQGKSERRVAEAAGLHYSSIGKIKRVPTE